MVSIIQVRRYQRAEGRRAIQTTNGIIANVISLAARRAEKVASAIVESFAPVAAAA